MNSFATHGEELSKFTSERTTRFAPLDTETRAAIDTAAAAYHLGRQPQTLRCWAFRENGPLRPIRVHGRLLWPVAELRRLVGA